MKFTIEITKEVIDKSLYCGIGSWAKEHDKYTSTASSCAFFEAFKELIPCIEAVGHLNTIAILDSDTFSWPNTHEQMEFISKFDNVAAIANKEMAKLVNEYSVPGSVSVVDKVKDIFNCRYNFVGERFEVEVPDELIDKLYQGRVELANKIANSKCISLTETI